MSLVVQLNFGTRQCSNTIQKENKENRKDANVSCDLIMTPTFTVSQQQNEYINFKELEEVHNHVCLPSS